MSDSEDFNCCSGSCGGNSGEQACECLKQDLAHRVIPAGTRKLAGQGREYRTTTGLWLTRSAFIDWSKNEGKQVDPIIWYTEMGHPMPKDLEPSV